MSRPKPVIGEGITSVRLHSGWSLSPLGGKGFWCRAWGYAGSEGDPGLRRWLRLLCKQTSVSRQLRPGHAGGLACVDASHPLRLSPSGVSLRVSLVFGGVPSSRSVSGREGAGPEWGEVGTE